MADLESLLRIARNKGYNGVMVIDQGAGSTPYVGAFVWRDGTPIGQTWNNYATPSEALEALEREAVEAAR